MLYLSPLVASVGCLLSRALNYGHIEILPVIAVKAAIGALYDTFGDPDCTVLKSDKPLNSAVIIFMPKVLS